MTEKVEDGGMAKYFTFPLELYDHPAIEDLNLCQSALFRILIEHYWKTGKPLPENPYALTRLSNADPRTFKKYGRKVMDVLKIMMPLFIAAREKRKRTKVIFQNNALNARDKFKIKKQLLSEPLSDESLRHDSITAVPPENFSNQYNQEMFDAPARIKALKSKENDDGKTFSD